MEFSATANEKRLARGPCRAGAGLAAFADKQTYLLSLAYVATCSGLVGAAECSLDASAVQFIDPKIRRIKTPNSAGTS